MKWLYCILDVFFHRLGKVHIAIYALLYLITIPLFACLYSLLPYEFYHATSHYEASLHNDRFNVVQGVLSTIVSGLNRIDGRSSAIWDGWSVDIWEGYISDLIIGEETIDLYKVSMTLYMNLSPVEPTGKPDVITLSPQLTIWVANRATFITGNADLLITDIDSNKVQIDENGRFALTKALLGSRCLGFWNNKVRIQLPVDTPDRIRGYIRAKRGFPSTTSGNYWRMLYFSSVTITTLGYGDIVPLSSRARLLVSLESILGIVLIGLFLNSLAFTFRTQYPKTES